MPTGGHPTSGPARFFEDLHSVAGSVQSQSTSESRDAGSDDGDSNGMWRRLRGHGLVWGLES